VTAPIIGAKTQAQLLDNLAAVEICFEPHELDTLDRVSALPAEYPGWMLARQGAERRALGG
jgi:aryl-alcohol dehydrogenase-like predicted oxidoreductase